MILFRQRRALKAAFPKTAAILTGFLFLGMSYGIYMRQAGFPAIYPILTAVLVYRGSLEFLIVNMLLSPFAPLQTLMMALLIQFRHLFYGIALLGRYKGTGLKKLYIIFGMCDESFSINYSSDIPSDVDRGWFMFFVNLLNQLYWVGSVAIGALVGDMLPFDTEGIEFVMTAMFLVIFIEQLLKEKQHISSMAGLSASLICLWLFGADSFLIPAMVLMLALLYFLRKSIERSEGTLPYYN